VIFQYLASVAPYSPVSLFFKNLSIKLRQRCKNYELETKRRTLQSWTRVAPREHRPTVATSLPASFSHRVRFAEASPREEINSPIQQP